MTTPRKKLSPITKIPAKLAPPVRPLTKLVNKKPAKSLSAKPAKTSARKLRATWSAESAADVLATHTVTAHTNILAGHSVGIVNTNINTAGNYHNPVGMNYIVGSEEEDPSNWNYGVIQPEVKWFELGPFKPGDLVLRELFTDEHMKQTISYFKSRALGPSGIGAGVGAAGLGAALQNILANPNLGSASAAKSILEQDSVAPPCGDLLMCISEKYWRPATWEDTSDGGLWKTNSMNFSRTRDTLVEMPELPKQSEVEALQPGMPLVQPAEPESGQLVSDTSLPPGHFYVSPGFGIQGITSITTTLTSVSPAAMTVTNTSTPAHTVTIPSSGFTYTPSNILTITNTPTYVSNTYTVGTFNQVGQVVLAQKFWNLRKQQVEVLNLKSTSEGWLVAFDPDGIHFGWQPFQESMLTEQP